MRLSNWLSWAGAQIRLGPTSFDAHGGRQQILTPADQEASINSTLKNYAAWIPQEKAQLEVAEAPFPEHGDGELVIRNRVVAVNPVDWKIQTNGGFNLKYPTILGEDVAGEVIKVGSKLKDQFHVGQRVISHTLGLGRGPAYGGFQLFPVLTAALTSPIPDDISFSEAAVLPLSISTAAAGLFLNSTLGLNFPELDSKRPTPPGSPALLVWGGSSSVGSTVIQLASAAGYTVITTASPSNYEYCLKLGATYVLDYHLSNIEHLLIYMLDGADVAGVYDAIGTETTVRQSAFVLDGIGGGKIASVGVAPDDLPKGVEVVRIGSGNILTEEPKVAKKIWGEYVPAALKTGQLIPSPEALVVGQGLEMVQKGLDRQKAGVSAQKVEVVLS